MAFLSDAHYSSRLRGARSLRASHYRLNWRLMIALALNMLAWVGIIGAVSAIL